MKLVKVLKIEKERVEVWHISRKGNNWIYCSQRGG